MPYRSPVADILFSLSAVADLPGMIGRGLLGDLDWDAVSVHRRGSRALRHRGNRAAQPPGRPCRRAVRERRRDNASRLRRRLPALGGGGLERRLRAGRVRRHGPAPSRQRRLHRNLERRLDGLRALPAPDRGRHRRLESASARANSPTSISPPMVSGRWTGTMNLTEPQAGSDLNAVQNPGGTRRGRILSPVRPEDLHHLWRARHGREYRPSRSRPAPRRAGRDARPVAVPGAEIPRQRRWLARRRATTCAAPSIEHKLGIHGSPTCIMVYGDNEGAKAWLVGEENRGLAAMFVMMNAARLAVGTQGVAIGDRAYQQALAYARERRQGRGAKGGDGMTPIIEHPDVQRMLMTMKANVHAARGICHLTGVSLDLAEPRRHRSRTNGRRQSRGAADARSPRRSRPTSATRRRRSASRSMAAWASSRRPARPSTCAIPASPRSTKARTASTRSISCSASCRWPAAKPSATRSPASARWRATSRPKAARASARRPSGSPRLRTRSKNRRGSCSTGSRPIQNSALAGASQYLRLFGLTLGGACLAKAGLAAEALAAERRRKRARPRRPRPLLRRKAGDGRARPRARDRLGGHAARTLRGDPGGERMTKTL